MDFIAYFCYYELIFEAKYTLARVLWLSNFINLNSFLCSILFVLLVLLTKSLIFLNSIIFYWNIDDLSVCFYSPYYFKYFSNTVYCLYMTFIDLFYFSMISIIVFLYYKESIRISCSFYYTMIANSEENMATIIF
jgi:hypothetical protein